MGEHGHDTATQVAHMGAAAHAASEFEHASHVIPPLPAHGHGVGGTGIQVPNLLAPFALWSGIDEMLHGESVADKVAGGAEAFSGGVGTVGLVAQTGNVIIDALAAGGADMAAAAAGGEALASVASTLGPAAAVAGAGAAGYNIGKAGNNFAARHGFLGENEDGSNRNWSNLAAHMGDETRDFFGGGTFGEVMGFGATLVGSGIGAVGATASAAASVVETIFGPDEEFLKTMWGDDYYDIYGEARPAPEIRLPAHEEMVVPDRQVAHETVPPPRA